MTDKEKLDAIRAEIHRLVDVRGYDREMANDLFAFIDSLPNEPVSEDLEEAAYHNCIDRLSKESIEDFKAGAKWKEEQFEKNRIEHCEDITEEQYKLETGFVDLYIERFNRLPTILDAIEYGKTLGEMLMIGEAVETTFNVSLPCGVYDKLKAKGCEDGDKLLIIKKED